MNLLKVLTLFTFLLPNIGYSSTTITLSSDNSLVLRDAFKNETVTALMEQATRLDANLPSGYPIYLFLYTPGGSIQAGLELIEFLAGLNRPVHTITLFAASMGWQTVQHLGERYITEYGVLMSHKARGTFSGEFGGLGVSQLDSRYQLWLRRVNLMDKKTVERTKGKQTLKSYTDSYTPELWLNGEEAVSLGYADQVAVVKCDTTLSGTRDEVLNVLGLFRVRITWSKCPMKTSPISYSVVLYTTQGPMTMEDFLSKGGIFGSCKETYVPTPTGNYSFYDPATPTTTNENKLCLTNESLTLEQITSKLEAMKSEYNQDLKDHIVYSY